MTESLSEIIKIIENKNSWFEVLKPEDLKKILTATDRIYTIYLIPKIVTLAEEGSGWYKKKDGLDILSKTMKDYDKIESNIKHVIWINKIISTTSLLVTLPIIPIIIFLIFLFFEKIFLISSLFPNWLFKEYLFGLNIFHFLTVIYILFCFVMIAFRIRAKFLMDEVSTLAVQYEFGEVGSEQTNNYDSLETDEDVLNKTIKEEESSA